MKVLKDFNNKLCRRTEYVIEVDHISTKTPSKEEIKKKVADLTKSKEDIITLKGIYTQYGFGKSLIHAYVYDDKESLTYFEVRNKKKIKKKND